jgi:hypothetical protein
MGKEKNMFYILLLRDIAEILFYSLIIYAVCIWLKTDKTKNILAYFLVYCTITLSAWALEMPTLAPFLFAYAPIALILLIVLHEKTLQRNLVALRTITPVHNQTEDWVDTLLSSALSVLNNNKSITVIIENNDSLDYFLTTPFVINADLGKGILNILLSSSSYEEHKMVWITKHGQIRGINTSWQEEATQQSLVHTTLLNKKDALFYTLQNDALIFHSNPHVRSFTIIAQGKELQQVPVNEIKTTIKKHLSLNASVKNKGQKHESSSTEKPLT